MEADITPAGGFNQPKKVEQPWRGAYIQNILNFERDYPDPKVIRLPCRKCPQAGTFIFRQQDTAHVLRREDLPFYGGQPGYRTTGTPHNLSLP